MGPRRALELSLTGRIFGVNEALQYGLIHEAVPAIELDDRATAIAQNLANASASSIALGLEFVQRTRGLGQEDGGKLAAEMRSLNFASADFAEGLAAFESRRSPIWPSLGAAYDDGD